MMDEFRLQQLENRITTLEKRMRIQEVKKK